MAVRLRYLNFRQPVGRGFPGGDDRARVADPALARGNASVITVVIDSANANR